MNLCPIIHDMERSVLSFMACESLSHHSWCGVNLMNDMEFISIPPFMVWIEFLHHHSWCGVDLCTISRVVDILAVFDIYFDLGFMAQNQPLHRHSWRGVNLYPWSMVRSKFLHCHSWRGVNLAIIIHGTEGRLYIFPIMWHHSLPKWKL